MRAHKPCLRATAHWHGMAWPLPDRLALPPAPRPLPALLLPDAHAFSYMLDLDKEAKRWVVSGVWLEACIDWRVVCGVTRCEGGRDGAEGAVKRQPAAAAMGRGGRAVLTSHLQPAGCPLPQAGSLQAASASSYAPCPPP